MFNLRKTTKLNQKQRKICQTTPDQQYQHTDSGLEPGTLAEFTPASDINKSLRRLFFFSFISNSFDMYEGQLLRNETKMDASQGTQRHKFTFLLGVHLSLNI